jgi:hypothetical protein
MNFAFPPPQRWQDFEELTVEVVRAVFADPGAQGHGRAGQAQAGVDVYGRELGVGRQIGVQCKRKEGNLDRPASIVTEQQIRDEVRKAEAFRPALDYFIIATTGSRDTGEQAYIRNIQAERTGAHKFPIALWYWEDFIGFLNSDARVSRWYNALLQGLYGDTLSDRQILSVMKIAFSRAAFRTPLHLESPAEFRPALLDTERAVNTGLLLDRETRMPICRASAGLSGISRDPDNCVRIICAAVQNLRLVVDEGLANGKLRTYGNCLVVEDRLTGEEIDRCRRDALRSLNSLLATHGETPIESALLAVHARLG